MEESLNIFDLANMRVRVHENGFSLWMLEPCDDGEFREKCLIDGSLVKQSGEIKINNREHKMFKSVYDKKHNCIKILKSK